ncbi:hypothetical protein Ancab_015081 [Ancistrocladus abbreviatus]
MERDANSFEPVRFLGSNIDVKGGDFKLIPFGEGGDFELIPFDAGRRICPEMSLANRMLPYMLDGVTPRNLDMEEKFGFTLQKAQSLIAIPVRA